MQQIESQAAQARTSSSELDTESCVHILLNDNIFNIRCSLVSFEHLREIKYDGAENLKAEADKIKNFHSWMALSNLIYHNPGSYPSHHNQVDFHSWDDKFRTESKIIGKFTPNQISYILQYLGTYDILSTRLVNRTFYEASMLAVQSNFKDFKEELKGASEMSVKL